MYSLDSSNRDMFFMCVYVLIFAVIYLSTFFTIFQCCMDSCDLHPGGSCFKTSQISFSCWNSQLQNVISLPRRFHPSPTKRESIINPVLRLQTKCLFFRYGRRIWILSWKGAAAAVDWKSDNMGQKPSWLKKTQTQTISWAVFQVQRKPLRFGYWIILHFTFYSSWQACVAKDLDMEK